MEGEVRRRTKHKNVNEDKRILNGGSLTPGGSIKKRDRKIGRYTLSYIVFLEENLPALIKS